MSESFSKKEKEKRRQQKKKDKEQRKLERQSQAKSGALEDMMAYVDENGNISSVPPDPTRKNVFKESDVIIGSRNIGGAEPTVLRKGRVTFFNASKAYGFIKDSQTGESIFVHTNATLTPVKEGDFVTFKTERGVKGLTAVGVKKV